MCQRVIDGVDLNNLQKNVSLKDCAELLVGKCNLSQRSYKTLKKVLIQNNVNIVSYSDARDYANNLDVGKILSCH